jgi:uncharacterized membrane protein YheB (UPF0754 family)
MRGQLDGLVHTDTWKRTGVSFEFAHFTDRQLAQAIHRLDRRSNRPTLEALIQAIASVRAARGNLKSAMGGVSKPDLADELWPVLERRLRESQRRATERRIPIVRVLDHAIRLAHEYPRRGLVLSLDERASS